MPQKQSSVLKAAMELADTVVDRRGEESTRGPVRRLVGRIGWALDEFAREREPEDERQEAQ